MFFLFSSTAINLVAILFLTIYFYVKYLYSYWQRRGVPYLKPSFPFGNYGKQFTFKLSAAERLDELYGATKEPFIGVFGLFRPKLIIRDPKLIQTVLIKDFQYFTDRGVYVDEENDPLSAHLFALEGEKWKSLRTKLTPTFTTGKMKAIFSTILECKNPLENYLAEIADSNETIEIREVIARYTTNVIASVAFGIDIDCFADPETPFRKYGRQLFKGNWRNAFRFFCFNVNPKLLKWSGLHFMDREVEDFIFDIVKQTLEVREMKNIVRKDFFQLLVQLRNTGTVQLDDEWQTVIGNNKTLTIDEIAAQAFIFYAAGFETTSSAMSFCVYLIAKHPEVQRKIHEEIEQVLEKYDGKLTYDAINELNYLECCIDESLRLYPVTPTLTRKCVKNYKIPDTNVMIEEGTAIVIPTFSLHRDEKFYPDPMKFDPTRFFAENKSGKTFIDMPYFPFGDGPRICIGSRLGKMTAKVGIVSILRKFWIKLGDQHTGKELKFSPLAFHLAVYSGMHLKFEAKHY